VPARPIASAFIGDRASLLRFDDALAPDEIDGRRGSEMLGSNGLLSADAMMSRNLLRRRLTDPDADRCEIETLGLELPTSACACCEVNRCRRGPPCAFVESAQSSA